MAGETTLPSNNAGATLGWIAKGTLALGGLLAVISAAGWQIDIDFSNPWAFHVLSSIGLLLALTLIVAAAVAMFLARPALDVALLSLAGWAVALTYPKFGIYTALGISDYGSYWPFTVAVIGAVVIGAGSLLLLGSIFLLLGRERSLTPFGSGVPDGIGRALLILGSLISVAAMAYLLTRWYGEDFTGVAVVAVMFGLVIVAATAVSLWRSVLIADVFLIGVAGWTAALAAPGFVEIAVWVDGIGMTDGYDYYGHFWTRWPGLAGLVALIFFGLATILLGAGVLKRLKGGGPAPAFAAAFPPAVPPRPQPQPVAAVPPGWHADPANPNQLRWWDGQTWTDHTAPGG